jgi:transcription initiation factor IIF auxiliary subunit
MYVPDVECKDSIFDPDSVDRTARWRNPKSDKPTYRVFLYLDGPGLPYVKAVTYVLHATFKDPTRHVLRTPANPHCKLELWTWGKFRVKAILTDQQGSTTTITHDLQYDQEFPSARFIAA